MSKTKAQLRYGLWPDSPAAARLQPELTVAARRMAASALEELNRLGVTVGLDKAGKAHFPSVRIPLRDARLTIERHGDSKAGVRRVSVTTLLRRKTAWQANGEGWKWT